MMADTGITLEAARCGRFQSYAATHMGPVRKLNEDAYVNRPDLGLWAVADGAGGHHAGEVASAEIASQLHSLDPDLSAGEVLVAVRARLDAAHARLQADAAQRGAGVTMASTVVVLLARGEHFACLWAGDSRAYLLRGQELTAVTRDHSVVQQLVDDGLISAAEAENHPHSNIITRAVGAGGSLLDVEKRTGRLIAGDRLLLCSDGLCKTLSDAQLAGLLSGAGETSAERLVTAALAANATDNITALTIDFGSEDDTRDCAAR